MSVLHPDKDRQNHPLTRELGFSTLAIGIILGFPIAIAGSSIYLTYKFFRSGEFKRAAKVALVGGVSSFLLFLFFQSPVSNLAIESRWYTIIDLILKFTAGFFGLAFIHFSIQSYEKNSWDTFNTNWIGMFSTILLTGIGLVTLISAGVDRIVASSGKCYVPGVLNSYKSIYEFRGLKSGLLQEKDLKDLCQYKWNRASISDEHDAVDHYLTGSFGTVSHGLTKSSTLLSTEAASSNFESKENLMLDLPLYGNQQKTSCQTSPVTESVNSIRCSIAVEYNYIVSRFYIQTFNETSIEDLEDFIGTMLAETDLRIQRLDHP